jgi:hypothetical protein
MAMYLERAQEALRTICQAYEVYVAKHEERVVVDLDRPMRTRSCTSTIINSVYSLDLGGRHGDEVSVEKTSYSPEDVILSDKETAGEALAAFKAEYLHRLERLIAQCAVRAEEEDVDDEHFQDAKFHQDSRPWNELLEKAIELKARLCGPGGNLRHDHISHIIS